MPVTAVEPDAKLALAEFLLSTSDLLESARRAVNWLASQGVAEQALAILADPDTG